MSVEDYFNNIKKNIQEDFTKAGDTVFNLLVDSSFINNIKESVFTGYFLRKFIGLENNSTWVMEWISVAGTPMSEVRVISDTDGSELFIVPPILQTKNVFLDYENSNMSHVLTRFEQYNNNLPQEGTRFLANAFSSKEEQLFNKIDNTKDKARWDYILTRYNLMPTKDTVTLTEEQDTQNLDDFISY